MGTSRRSLEIVRTLSSRQMLRVARELGLVRPKPPTEEGALALRATLEELGTTFIKLGQLLSTRPDVITELYADVLSDLQDDIAPFPGHVAREIIEQSLGRPLNAVFAAFDDQPLASASIAQIHVAELHSGERVVVKVRRPDIHERVEQDLEILRRLAHQAQAHVERAKLVQLRSIVDELSFSLRRELDMRADAENTILIGDLLSEFDCIIVPRVYEELVREEVLVMQYLEGDKVTDVRLIEQGRAKQVADEFLRAYIKMIIVDGVYHADPHAGNVLLTPDHRLALLDFGLIGKIDDNTRTEFGILLLAMAENRAEDLTDLLLRMSTTGRTSDEQAFHREIRRLLPRYRHTTLANINIGAALVEIQRVALRCRIGLPIQFALMGKTLSQVDSITRFLYRDVDPLEVVRRYATDVIMGQVHSLMTPSALIATLGNPMLALSQLPRRTEHLMERLERGEVTIGITPVELEELTDEMTTLTNRLSTALFLSALVIASAVLMHVEDVGEIAGYPALGFLGFVAAMLIGLVLIVRMIRHHGGL